MFLMIPYKTDLKLNQQPFITYAVILICIVVYYAQTQNRKSVSEAAQDYCVSIHDRHLPRDSLDELRTSVAGCKEVLKTLHRYLDLDELWSRIEESASNSPYTRDQLKEIYDHYKYHYEQFSAQAPGDLDRLLMYQPDSFNPLKMVSATLAHADFWHIFGNLLFFFAFTPALELLAGSRIKFIGMLLSIALVTGIVYSLTELIADSAIPTLGLSGVVSGMIGFAAYMMPKAGISTFFWFMFYAWRASIPVWFLALWFIGLDAYDLFTRTDNGGVNLVAHVSGGIAGYLLGRLWFHSQREDYKDELDDAIKLAHSDRSSRLGVMDSYAGNQREILAKQEERIENQKLARIKDRLFQCIRTGQTGEALMMLLDNINANQPEQLESSFEEIGQWDKGYIYQCLGRLLIHEYLRQGRTGNALRVVKPCLQANPEFRLADPDDLFGFVREIAQMHQPDLALSLLKNARARYGAYIDPVQAKLVEAEILALYLNQLEQARHILIKLQKFIQPEQRLKYQSLLAIVDGTQ
jgi:membrane associated rhomboid family serine protease